MAELRDISGKRFGRLTVMRPEDISGTRTKWLCQCDCGIQKIVRQDHLEKGETLSCGCIRDEKIGALNKRKNKYVIVGNIVEFATFAGHKFTIDLRDLDLVCNFCWHKSNTGYFVTHINRKITQIHRLLLDPPEDMYVDHVNRDKSDNRRCNLRVCTQSENSRNQGVSKLSVTGVTGVTITAEKTYYAYIANKYIGKYKNIDEAIVARLSAEKELYGEFAPQTHLFERYGI